MITEKSAGVIAFYIKEGVRQYLLLEYHNNNTYYGFARGNIEGDETQEAAALRELAEETAIIDVNLILGFKESITWFYSREQGRVHKFLTMFLGKTQSDAVTISSEHQGYLWLPYEEALEKLTFEDSRSLLVAAETFIQTQFGK